jgi:hypothetical protein
MMREERRTIECEALVNDRALLIPENVRHELSSWTHAHERFVDRLPSWQGPK